MSIDLAIAVPQDCPAGSGRDRWWLEWCRRDDELGSGQTGGSAREVRQGPRRRPLRPELPEGRRQDLQQVGNPQGALCGGVATGRRNRKDDVEGKCGSVRGLLGGCRNIKKNK